MNKTQRQCEQSHLCSFRPKLVTALEEFFQRCYVLITNYEMNENYYRTMSKIILYQFCIINKYYFDVKGSICDERRARGRARARAGAGAQASKLNIIIIAYPVGSANNTKSCHLCADNRLKKWPEVMFLG